MEPSAHVTSIDAIRALREALRVFDLEARDALALLGLEVRRAMEWFEQDRRRYWPEQVRRASEKLVQARNDLERCQLKYGSEEAPSCYPQKKALDQARRRLRFCESRVKETRKWTLAVRQEVQQFDAQMAKLNNGLDSDVPRAVAALERMLAALEHYTGGGRGPAAGSLAAGAPESAGKSPPRDPDEPGT